VRVVISQPMYFPWVGLLEQFKAADIFVFYDDVQFVKGSLFNRVQVKTKSGVRWLTVPLKNRKLSQYICETGIDDQQDWRKSHLSLLRQSYEGAPYFDDMIELAESVLKREYANLAELSISSMLAQADYFNISQDKKILRSSEMNVSGVSSQRVFDICKNLGATRYITGHGAANYLDHELFEETGIDVCYMNYEKTPYQQLNGEFTPFVSGLDLVANCGENGSENIKSGSIIWKKFLTTHAQNVKS
jgi:WbqC-like protein family